MPMSIIVGGRSGKERSREIEIELVEQIEGQEYCCNREKINKISFQ